MPKLINTGRMMFAIGMFGLAILSIIYGDFIVGRPPAWPLSFSLKSTLAYVSAGVLIVAVISIITKKKAATFALSIAALILVLSVFRHLPVFMNDWLNTYKAIALTGGALIIASSFFVEEKQRGTGLMNREGADRLALIGTIMLSIFYIACGYAHFKWPTSVANMIPQFIPLCLFWAYFCGVCLFAGGVGIMTPRVRRTAAVLTGVMILGWFFLFHIPKFLANTNDPSDRMGLCESFTFSGIMFVLAGMFSKNTPRGKAA